MGIEPPAFTGQRRDSRLRLALPARLVTLQGYESAFLSDLSQSGARVYLRDSDGMRPGADAMVSWLGYEAFGRVVWSRYGFVGMEFDELLPVDILLDTREKVDLGLAPSADKYLAEKAREWFESSR